MNIEQLEKKIYTVYQNGKDKMSKTLEENKVFDVHCSRLFEGAEKIY